MAKYTPFDPNSDTHTLPEIAQSVHEDVAGGHECASVDADVLCLQERLKAWKPGLDQGSRYDAAVYELVAAVLAEVEAKGRR